MKRVYYIRHAKSSWADLHQRDVDRPLNKRGIYDAPIMATKLAEMESHHLDMKSDLKILSSHSKRTRETLSYFQEQFTIQDDHVILDSALYLPTHEQLLESLFQLEDTVETVMLFTHNPAISDFVHHVSSNFVDNIPTCGIIKVTYNVKKWNEVSFVNARKEFFIYPKMYKA